MFKLTLKLAILSFVLTGTFMALSGSKVSAATCAWAPGNPNSPPAMGFHHGEADDNFAGVAVKASVGNMTDGNADDSGHGGQLVNIAYQLNSRLPDAGAGNHYYNPANSQNINARIFTLDANGNPIDRNDSHTFRTGETLYSPSGSFSCDGWSALGPGTYTDEIGNRFGVDCGQEVLQDGTNAFVRKELTRYWINNIPNPYGQNGYWDIQIKDESGNVTRVVRNGQMSYGSGDFQVGNGTTKYIDLVWHKEPRKTFDGGHNFLGACEQLSATNLGSGNPNRRRMYVEITGISLGKLRVFDKDGNLNQAVDYPNWPGDSGRPRSVNSWVGGSPGENGVGPGENGQTKIWNYIPWDSNSIHLKVEVQDYWDNDNNGSKTWNTINLYDETIACYTATCSIQSVTGDGPGGIVVADGWMHIHATMTNTSRDNLQLWNPPLSDGGGNLYGSDVVLDSGDTHHYYIDVRAPPSVGYYDYSHGFVFYPVYFGRTGNDCSGSVPIYQYFNIQPRANIVNTDPENPTTVTYTGGGQLISGPPVTVNTHVRIDKQSVAGCPSATEAHDTTDTYGNLDHTYTYANNCINAGDLFCAHTTISPANGWHGPSGDIFTNSVTADSSCLKTVNRPYSHFFGSDVRAGGGFGNSCQKTAKGVIYTYNNTPSGAANGANKGGTGAQFGAHAMDIISGLGSASLRGSAPTGLSGLSFANTEHIGGAAPSPTTGGYLGDAGLSNFCVPDYFGDKPALLSTNPDVPLTQDANTTATAGAGNAKQWHKPPVGGTLTLNGGTINNGVSQAIFVEGNVNITEDIKYSTTARSSVKDIPSFYLVVKNGNIRISPGVKQLDGVYIAQPDTTDDTTINKTGIINTCFIGNNFDDIYNQCKNQLVINGAFVANRVLLARSYSSLRFSQSGENNMSGGSHSCGHAGKDVPASSTSAADCASEIFNFSPELYMSQPAINARFGAPSGKYDAITSLSPVL
jgi:hypothetical protein